MIKILCSAVIALAIFTGFDRFADAAPIHDAVQRSRLSDVRALIQANADVNLPNEIGYTPLMLAVLSGNIYMVAELLQSPDIDVFIENNEGNTALMLAPDNGCRARDQDGNNLTISEAIQHHVDKQLIRYKHTKSARN